MIRRNIREIGRRWRQVAASIAILGIIAGTALPAAPAFAAATYSCGTYSSGAYSSNGACGTSTGGGTGSSGGTGTIGAPNTGFAKLMEPANLAAILGSLALIIVGIAIALKSRKRKKHPVSFDA